MSKYMILCFAMSLISLASERRIDIALNFQTNLKIREIHLVRIIGSTVYVDGEKIGKEGLMLVGTDLSRLISISKVRSISSSSCAAGTFIHSVSMNGKERAELGCINDTRFYVLNASLVKLKKAAMLPNFR